MTTERIKRDHRGVTLERLENGVWAGVYMLPWELPRLAEQLRDNHHLDDGHRALLRAYAMGRPLPEYFQVYPRPHHHNWSEPVHKADIGYVLPDYANPGAYYLFTQPQAFDGRCVYPEPQWQGDYWWQTVRLPVPPGARIIDAQPCRDETGKIAVRWSRAVTKTHAWNELNGMTIDDAGEIHATGAHFDSVEYDEKTKRFSGKLTADALRDVLELRSRFARNREVTNLSCSSFTIRQPPDAPKPSGDRGKETTDET